MLRLHYFLFEKPIECIENQVNVLVLENPRAYRDFIVEVKKLLHGEVSQIGLSKDFEEVLFAKYVEVIFSVLDLDFDNKKFLNKIYSELSKQAVSEELYIKTLDYKKMTVEYLNEIILYSEIPLEFHDIEIETLVRAVNVKIEICENDFVNNICIYMNMYQHYLGVETFMFFNLKTLLEENEILKLYEFCEYQKYGLLLCETSNEKKLKGEKEIIIDNDLCQIC